MAGIGVEEVKTVNITTTDGQKIEMGDIIVICVKGQDVVCRFVELDKNGYFVTAPLVAETGAVKYRLNSIEKCYKVTQFVWHDHTKDEKPIQEVGQDAAQGAAQEVLQPGA